MAKLFVPCGNASALYNSSYPLKNPSNLNMFLEAAE
jgi:hypothetical protein